jgi:hypothetical protein
MPMSKGLFLHKGNSAQTQSSSSQAGQKIAAAGAVADRCGRPIMKENFNCDIASAASTLLRFWKLTIGGGHALRRLLQTAISMISDFLLERNVYLPSF